MRCLRASSKAVLLAVTVILCSGPLYNCECENEHFLPPQLEVEPTILQFDDVAVGYPQERTLKITNLGKIGLLLEKVDVRLGSASPFSVLGVTLFEQLGKKVHLTSGGRSLLERARRMGMDPLHHLGEHNSYPFFSALRFAFYRWPYITRPPEFAGLDNFRRGQRRCTCHRLLRVPSHQPSTGLFGSKIQSSRPTRSVRRRVCEPGRLD